MKYSTGALAAAILCQTASAHYIWETVNKGAAFQYFRQNSDYNSPVTDTTSTDMRCNVGASAGGQTQIQTLAVVAGAALTLGLDTAVYHDGPVMFYLGKVPAGQTADSWDGSGANWFKFDYRGPSQDLQTWPLSQSYTVTVPSGVAPGQYLLRAEQIGIHNPAGLPQFYVGCAQIAVTGSGSCAPPLFSIPGHITATDPGITANIYTGFTCYHEPGPAVYQCPGGVTGDPQQIGSGCTGGSSPPPAQTTTKAAPPAPTTTASVKPTTTASAKPTTTPTTTAPTKPTTTSAAPSKTSSAPTSGQTLYGQCGGTGWTGPTTCSSGTCKVLNAYYSQCS